MSETVVLAYSGGLDTSVAVPWLRETHGHEVVTLTADVGGGPINEQILARAISGGARRAIGVDARAPFVTDYVWPALQAGARYQGSYPLELALLSIVNNLGTGRWVDRDRFEAIADVDRHLVLEDRTKHGDPEHLSDIACRVEDAGGASRDSRRHVMHDSGGHGREGEAHSQSGEDQ